MLFKMSVQQIQIQIEQLENQLACHPNDRIESKLEKLLISLEQKIKSAFTST